ncbi:hypothetical protein Q4F19_15940 [Sphingomonas sp. BIUV-7]|uniref:Carboxymuconolactone decarboxylase-like domain-containing protein n=1 Tax=Sphingomonas natans TaxID=3063330 RepID=A0ABT8YC25_9SPHN|nr:DUF6628 family protein [Sphingomonas sp. BIUV-7]MDO6415882.1 hypothetical protein [Sphingomonas sp. BIUV-7]
MRESHSQAAGMLPFTVPESAYARLLLYAVRRMAAGGLDDAFAAQAMIGGFGVNFRRPLVLLRAFMGESARVAGKRLMVAPCCCGRMTGDERALLSAVALAQEQPEMAHDRLAETLGVKCCVGLLTSAQAVAASFADLGMPLTLALEV